MVENIVLSILLFSIAATCIFVYGIIEDAIQQRRRRKKLKKLVAPESPPRTDSVAVESATQKSVACVFDSPELFREDAWVRIERLEEEIHEDLRRMKEHG